MSLLKSDEDIRAMRSGGQILSSTLGAVLAAVRPGVSVRKLDEIAEREPEYEHYIAPQKEYADAVIGIDYSEYGRHLGTERNVYRITLSQNRMKHSIENIDLSLDLYSILSLSERNFSLKFLTSENKGHKMGEMIIDGELSEHVVKKLERSIEQQTRVHPISIFKNRNYITAGDLAQLILCWRIIHRRIFIETTQESHVRSENTSEKEE